MRQTLQLLLDYIRGDCRLLIREHKDCYHIYFVLYHFNGTHHVFYMEGDTELYLANKDKELAWLSALETFRLHIKQSN